MEYRHHATGLQVSDELRSLLDILQLHIEHMRIMLAVRRDGRQRQQPFLRQRRKARIVLVPGRQSVIVNLISQFQLPPQASRLQFTRQEAAAEIDPGIFVHLAAQELAAVGTLLTQNFGAFDKAFVIDHQRAAFTAAGVVFGFMEAESRQVTFNTNEIAFVFAHDALRGVFDHQQVMLVGQAHDRIHIAGDAGVMHGHNGFGFIGDRRSHQRCIHIHGFRVDIDEFDFRAAQHEGIGGTDEGVAWHDNFVARLDIDQQRGDLQRGGARWGQQRVFAPQLAFKPFLALFAERAVARQFPILQRRIDILNFVAGYRWFVERYHVIPCCRF